MTTPKILGLLLILSLSMQTHAKEAEAKQPMTQPDGSEHIKIDSDVIQIIRPEPPRTETQEMFDRLGQDVQPNDQVAEGPSGSR
jgi:hypothetical protein